MKKPQSGKSAPDMNSRTSENESSVLPLRHLGRYLKITLIQKLHLFKYKVLHLKPNGAHGVSPLPRLCWIPPIQAAFMRAHGLAVCTPQYCTGHQHEQANDSTATHFRV